MAQLTLSFLGFFRVTLGGQPITHFRASNNQALLAYLALHAGTPQPREVLAALLWPEETTERSRNNLRQALYQLRSLLGDLERPQQPFFLTTRQSVTFNAESDYAIDVQNFLAAIDGRDLNTAVSIYKGDLLAGFTCDSAEFEDWQRREQQRLHRLAMAAMNELAQDQLQAGELDDAQATARLQLSFEPWREPAFRQLMRAYALAGDRANALAQYETSRAVLQEELGIEPAARTKALYEEIRSGRLGPVESDQTIEAPQRRRHNLPAETTPLIGREHELAHIQELFSGEGQRLVTIAGPGGMGKTRLAQSAGLLMLPSFRDGVYLVDLAPLEQPDEIPAAIAAALAYQVPDKSQPILPQLLRTLSQRQMLFILDNFEHLLAGASLVTELLQSCPDVALLVTSRQRLHLATESRFELGGLDYPDSASTEDPLSYSAVQLFVANGRRARADFALNEENVDDVVRITLSVQGMPLGLLLAASWLELLSTAEIAREIDSGVDFLSAELADLPPRQRSMQAVLVRSWEMMTPDEQRVLARLSVFRSGFTRDAAEEVAGANLRILFSLVNKSLIQRQPGNGRFVIHELLRQFAASRREAEEEVEHIHCAYFTQIVETEIRRGLGFWPHHLPTLLSADRDNIRRAWEYALEFGLADSLPTLTRALVTFSFVKGSHPTAILEQAVSTLQQLGYEETHPVLLEMRLMSTHFLYDSPKEKRQLMELLSEIKEQDNPVLLYWTYQQLTQTHWTTDSNSALDWADKAYQTALRTDDKTLIRRAEVEKVWVQVQLGVQEDSALPALQAMLVDFEKQFAISEAVILTLFALSEHCLSIGEYELGISYANKSRNIGKAWQDVYWITTGDHFQSKIYLALGRRDLARRSQLDALDWHLAIAQVWQTIGDIYWVCVYQTELVDDPETIVPILSMIHQHPESVPSYRQGIEKKMPDLKEELGEEAFEAAWERGKEMDFETAVAEFRAALSQ